MLKKVLKSPFFRRVSDILLSPVTLVSAIWYRYVRTGNASSMPFSEKIFMGVGVLPVIDHYYQPLINPSRHLRKPLNEDRSLPGIDWNVEEQLQLLKKFSYVQELRDTPIKKNENGKPVFYYENPSFCPGDAEYFYNLVRHFKPCKIIEIGCGYSTLLALKAVLKNKVDNPANECTHVCIEPYEMPWLEQLEVQIHRKKVEDMDLSFFAQLQRNDILFIDSSHIIRPQGDVLYEFQQILPTLNPGVLIHVHDIFSPRDYLKRWIVDEHCFWNEQYMLEAFLTFNTQFRIIGALNYLKHHHGSLFEAKCPGSERIENDEPGSFWMVRN